MTREQRFLPAGLIIVSAILIVGGLAFAVIATPALQIRGGSTISILSKTLYQTDQLSPGIFVLSLKGMLGLILSAMAVGLLFLHEPSRRGVIAFLVIFGLLLPAVISMEFARIDLVFVRILRLASITLSMICIIYLTRASTNEVFAQGGLRAHHVYRYCPICSTRGLDEGESSCPHCEAELLDRYETDCGLVFAKPVAAKTEGA